jgi:hypothetical protein
MSIVFVADLMLHQVVSFISSESNSWDSEEDERNTMEKQRTVVCSGFSCFSS